MPVHLASQSISRRGFFASLLAASGAAAGILSRLEKSLGVQELLGGGSEAWALFSDTHIAADAHLDARGINMASHLSQAVGEALEFHATRPFAGMMVNGDCAYLDGQSDDYQTFGTLIGPVYDKGIPIHITLGNHDERSRIQEGLGMVFGNSKTQTENLEGTGRASLPDKLASRLRSRFCDWYLLDSLEVTNKTPGRLGPEQLAWLEASLSASPERNALVMMHHNPQPPGPGKMTGLNDSEALMALLVRHRQVKALFFGHTHVAKTTEVEGLHLVNLPACAYRFSPEQPTGWTAALVGPKGCSLTLFDTEKNHPLHGSELRLEWRV
jgi:3',5'-cyclic AMP phosphodiesterase CpdA